MRLTSIFSDIQSRISTSKKDIRVCRGQGSQEERIKIVPMFRIYEEYVEDNKKSPRFAQLYRARVYALGADIKCFQNVSSLLKNDGELFRVRKKNPRIDHHFINQPQSKSNTTNQPKHPNPQPQVHHEGKNDFLRWSARPQHPKP